MFIIKNFLINSKHKERDAYFWNSSSAMLNSFQLVIILLIISRIDNIKDAGNFVIAYAIANLLIMIGRYGVRLYQVSDINEQFIFNEYLFSRVITTFLMMVTAFVYVGFYYFNGSYDVEKSIVILLVCSLKAVDAFEDVYHGLLQQHDNLDIAGKILTIRLFIYILQCMILYYFTHSLIITIAICLITTIILSIILNRSVLKAISYKKAAFNYTHFKNLTKDCFPIFISTFLQIYMANAPKYSIDIVLTSQEQAEFNYIFMPVFVISLLSTFIYQPLVHRLAIIWNQKNFKKFWLLILRQTAIIAILTLLCMIMGYLLGIPVLSLLYSVDLSAYRAELVILLLGGGLMAAVNFFTMVITVTRYQKHLVWGYMFISLLFLLGGKKAAISYGIMGISSFYTIASACLTFVVLIYICIIVKLSKHKVS